MEPISSMNSGAMSSLSAAAGMKEPPRTADAEKDIKGVPAKPVKDEYIPEEKREATGRYWPDTDEEGRPKINFDDPEKDASDKKAPGEKASDKKTERCTGNTDKVDREIEKLKRKQKELKQQINSETDEGKIKELEKKLSQVERELRQKDNDAYRRQHTTFV